MENAFLNAQMDFGQILQLLNVCLIALLLAILLKIILLGPMYVFQCVQPQICLAKLQIIIVWKPVRMEHLVRDLMQAIICFKDV